MVHSQDCKQDRRPRLKVTTMAANGERSGERDVAGVSPQGSGLVRGCFAKSIICEYNAGVAKCEVRGASTLQIFRARGACVLCGASLRPQILGSWAERSNFIDRYIERDREM